MTTRMGVWNSGFRNNVRFDEIIITNPVRMRFDMTPAPDPSNQMALSTLFRACSVRMGIFAL